MTISANAFPACAGIMRDVIAEDEALPHVERVVAMRKDDLVVFFTTTGNAFQCSGHKFDDVFAADITGMAPAADAWQTYTRKDMKQNDEYLLNELAVLSTHTETESHLALAAFVMALSPAKKALLDTRIQRLRNIDYTPEVFRFGPNDFMAGVTAVTAKAVLS